MKNAKIFDFGLFKAQFLRLKGIGLVGLIAFTFFAISGPVSEALNCIETGTTQTVRFMDDIYQVFLFVFYTPALMLSAFRFLNKRNTSDFYHAIPYTRLCLYISNVLAVMAWITATCVLMTVSSVVVFKIFSAQLIIQMSTIFTSMLCVWAGCLLCGAAVALAGSISGTEFSAFCTTGLILFLPRMVISSVISFISDALPMVSQSYLVPVLSNRYNIVYGTVSSVRDGSIYDVYNGDGILYTIVLAVIYFAIGAVVFKKRNSETAEQISDNPKVTMIIEAAGGLFVTLSILLSGMSGIYQGQGIDVEAVFTAVVITIIAIVVFDWSANGSLKYVKRTIPAILVSLILGGAICLVTHFTITGIANQRYDAKDILSFNVCYDYGYSEIREYYESKRSEFDIDDEKAIQLVTEVLNRDADRASRFDGQFFRGMSETRPLLVKLNDSSAYRFIYVTDKEIDVIYGAMESREEYWDMYRNLPSFDQINMYSDELTRERSQKVYEAYREEIKNIDIRKIFGFNSDMTRFRALHGECIQDNRAYFITVNIAWETPKTMDVYLTEVNAEYSDRKNNVIKYVEDRFDETVRNSDMRFQIYDKDNKHGKYVSFDNMLEYDRKVIEDIMESVKLVDDKTKLDLTKPFVEVGYTDYENYDSNAVYYVQPDGYDSIFDYYAFEQSENTK